MPIANFLAMALGFVIAAIGVLGIAAPSALLEFGRSLQSASALYVLAALRVALGTILVWAAPDSRTPRTLRIFGVLIIVAGVATPFIGVERSRAIFDWWSTQGTFFTRTWPATAVIFGLFVAYAALPRGSGA
jgi:hypothetical protein